MPTAIPELAAQMNDTEDIERARSAKRDLWKLVRHAGRPGADDERGSLAAMLADLRVHFAGAGVLEVETPVLGRGGVSDPHLEPLAAELVTAARPGGERIAPKVEILPQEGR